MTLEKLSAQLRDNPNEKCKHVYRVFDTFTQTVTTFSAYSITSLVNQIQNALVIDVTTVVLDYQGNTILCGADKNSELYKVFSKDESLTNRQIVDKLVIAFNEKNKHTKYRFQLETLSRHEIHELLGDDLTHEQLIHVRKCLAILNNGELTFAEEIKQISILRN